MLPVPYKLFYNILLLATQMSFLTDSLLRIAKTRYSFLYSVLIQFLDVSIILVSFEIQNDLHSSLRRSFVSRCNFNSKVSSLHCVMQIISYISVLGEEFLCDIGYAHIHISVMDNSGNGLYTRISL